MERVMGIEPTLEAWEAAVLPLNYTRSGVVPSAQSRSRGGDYSAPFFIAAACRRPAAAALSLKVVNMSPI